MDGADPADSSLGWKAASSDRRQHSDITLSHEHGGYNPTIKMEMYLSNPGSGECPDMTTGCDEPGCQHTDPFD